MNEGKNTFIWKSNVAPVAAGVPIENNLLFLITAVRLTERCWL